MSLVPVLLPRDPHSECGPYRSPHSQVGRLRHSEVEGLAKAMKLWVGGRTGHGVGEPLP